MKSAVSPHKLLGFFSKSVPIPASKIKREIEQNNSWGDALLLHIIDEASDTCRDVENSLINLR